MSVPPFITAELLMWVFGGLLTVIAGLTLHIFFRLSKTVDRIENKIDALEQKNAQDHAIVQGRLGTMEERSEAVVDAVKGLSHDHEELRRDVQEIDRKVVLLRGSVN